MQNKVEHQFVCKLNKIVSILASTINKFDVPLFNDSSNKNKYVNRILQHINDSENELKELMNKNQNHLWNVVAGNPTEVIHFIQDTTYIPKYTMSDIELISTGYYTLKVSERYFTNSINQIKVFEHKRNKNCIKIIGISSRFTSSKKHSLILRFYTQHPEDTKFYCSCKSGARTTNPCAHSLCIIMLIHSIQQQISHLSLSKHVISYYDLFKGEQYSSYYRKLYDSILDCKIYKEWSSYNETSCVCNEPCEEDSMVKCSVCLELYHPDCIDQTRKETEDNIDEWKCPYCEEDERTDIDDDETDTDDS